MTPPEPLCVVLGDNNVWALPLADAAGGGWLLVDAGIDSGTVERASSAGGAGGTWALLVDSLAAHGVRHGDVRCVIVTHEHIDHAGLAGRWAAEGARIVASRAAVPALAAGYAGNEAQRPLRFEELRRHGCPDDFVERLRPLRGRGELRWAPCPAEAIEPAEDWPEHRLAGGGTLRLLLAAGHTPGNLVAFVEESGALFSGDTLLPTTIPTPGLHFPGAVEGDRQVPRWPSLPPFLRSVAALRGLDVARIYPGHGEVVAEAGRLFEQFEAHHARRARRIRAVLEGEHGTRAGHAGGGDPLASPSRGEGAQEAGRTAYEIARALFPRLPDARLGQAITEVIGHLDVLEQTGDIVRLPGELLRWRLSRRR